jgi:8-oxo-dGTP diphosphatase
MPKSNKLPKRTIFGVSGVAVNRKGEFLLTLRNDPTNPRAHLKWHFPGGGIEFGEHPLDTLDREIKEEIGVKPQPIFSRPLIKTWVLNEGSVHLTILFYVVKLNRNNIKLDQTENIDYRWVKPEVIGDLDLLDGTAKIIADVQKMLIHESKTYATINQTGEGNA